MPSSGMLHHVALVRTDGLEELSASIIKVVRITELGTMLCRFLVMAKVVPSSPILVTLIMEVLRSSRSSVHTRATWRNVPEVGILQEVEAFASNIHYHYRPFSFTVLFFKSYQINYSEDNVKENNLVMGYTTLLTVLGHEIMTFPLQSP
jgi:hypothetical protein